MATLEQLKAADKKLADQRRKIRAAIKGTPPPDDSDERTRDAERKREQRRVCREVVIPKCASKSRRTRMEKDDDRWLRYYFGKRSNTPSPFTYKFTRQQREMIAAIRHAIEHGGDQAIAASRGEGKTTICERLLTKYVLQGVVPFAVLFAATGSSAGDSLQTIKESIEENDLLLADYPEICVPVRALENTPNRAHYQLVSGNRHDNGQPYTMQSNRFSWCGQEIVLPSVPGAPAGGAVIATRGLDAAVRGLKKKSRRPTVAIIDDPDTEETTRSEEQADKLEARIDKAIAGLGTQKRPIARVMLTTIQNRCCVSYKFTDPEQKATWNGKRYRFLVKPPDRMDLWEEYLALRQWDMQAGDRFAERACKYYVDNREPMDGGSEVANPNRFDPEHEVSALQHYFNQVGRIGQEAVSAEYDNDPPEEAGPIESGITAHRVQTQVSGYPRCVIPPGCTVITQGVDVRKVALHWVVRAWRLDATGFVIDYGVQDVHGTVAGSDEGVDVAIVKAIQARMSDVAEGNYHTLDGEILPVDLTLVDAGWRTDAVYHACHELGLGIMPAMGFGKTAGCVKTQFNAPVRSDWNRKPGDGWFMSRRPCGVWLACMDTDRWKAWEHDRWMTPTDKPGTLFMWGEDSDGTRLSYDQKAHHSYSRHIVAEVEVEEPIKGVLVRKWKAKSGNNHWLDASYMADVAANMKGISLLKRPPKPEQGSWYAQGPKGQPEQQPHAPPRPRRKDGLAADGWESG